MMYLFIASGMNVFIIFMLQRSWLFNKKYFEYILVFNTLLFILGFIMHLKYATALKIPLLHQLSFLILTAIFRKIYHRNPKDTYRSMDWKLMPDGIFNFIFVILLAVFVILVL
jgi:hypothetical protein